MKMLNKNNRKRINPNKKNPPLNSKEINAFSAVSPPTSKRPSPTSKLKSKRYNCLNADGRKEQGFGESAEERKRKELGVGKGIAGKNISKSGLK